MRNSRPKGQVELAYILGFFMLMLIVALTVLAFRGKIFGDTNVAYNNNNRQIHNVECISKTYQTNPAIVAGVWSLGDGSGSTASVSGGASGNGALSNGPRWESGAACGMGSCLQFNGLNQNMFLDNVAVNTTEGAYTTIEFYMNWTGDDKRFAFSWPNYGLYFTNNCFGFNTGGVDVYGINSSGLENKLTQVTAVFYNGANVSGTNMTSHLSLYLNGVWQPLSQCAGTAKGATVSREAYLASGYGGSFYFGGLMSQLVLYNRALSDQEASDDFNCHA